MKNLNPEIANVLAAYNIKFIETAEDLNALITVVDENGFTRFKPNPEATANTVIIFDNENYNSAYLHEHYDVFVKNVFASVDELKAVYETEEEKNKVNDKFLTTVQKGIDNTNVFYCNSPEISNNLFVDFFAKSLHLPFDNNSTVVFFNSNVDEVFIQPEIFQPITSATFANIFSVINEDSFLLEIIDNEEISKPEQN